MKISHYLHYLHQVEFSVNLMTHDLAKISTSLTHCTENLQLADSKSELQQFDSQFSVVHSPPTFPSSISGNFPVEKPGRYTRRS